MKRILVTGAGGFIGSHLVEELVKTDNEVVAFIKYNGRNDWGNLERVDKHILDHVEVAMGDISDPYFVNNAVKRADVVFHLAALIGIPYSYVAPESYVRVNVSGTLNILQACRANGVGKLIHTSTSETYGTAVYAPIDEKHPMQAQSPYSASKMAADKLVESFYLSFNLPVVTIRPFNTYGPRQSARAVIPAIISQLLSPSDTVRLGSLDPVRDFCYVKDTVNAFVLAMTRSDDIGRVMNVGTGIGVTIGEIVNTLQGIIGTRKTIRTDPERIRPSQSEVMKLICDNALAKQVIGWSPKHDLEKGLANTVEYMRENMRMFKAGIYSI